MKDIKFVLKEHTDNIYKIFRLAFYDFITPLRDTYLGAIWIFLGPLLQIGVYWFVFGLGIRGGKPVDDHPYILWMLAGLVPWFYISASISKGASSIYSKANLLSKMKFPTSIIPTHTIITELFNSAAVIIVMVIVFASYGYKANIYYFGIIYYIFAATIILIAIALLTSALVVAFRDINKVISSLIRFLFYLTPILWIPSNLPEILQKILKLNPFIYIVEGFRNCLLYNSVLGPNIRTTIYFWSVTLVLLMIGIYVHMRLRKRFSDLLQS